MSAKNFEARGVIPANVTARGEEGEVHLERTKSVVQYLYSKGADGLHVCGTTGEFASLSVEDRMAVTEACVEAAGGRGTVIIHVGAVNTDDSCRLASHAREAGADAVSSVPPHYYPVREEHALAHYRSIAEAADLPVIIYDNPGTTGFTVTPELASELADEGAVHGIKLATQDMVAMARFANLQGGDFVIYPVETFYLAGLATAPKAGTIGSMSNWIPEAFVGIKRNYEAGNISRAAELQRLVCELIVAYQVEEIAATKELVRHRGVECGGPWKPLLPLNDEQCRGLLDRIDRFNLDYDALAEEH